MRTAFNICGYAIGTPSLATLNGWFESFPPDTQDPAGDVGPGTQWPVKFSPQDFHDLFRRYRSLLITGTLDIEYEHVDDDDIHDTQELVVSRDERLGRPITEQDLPKACNSTFDASAVTHYIAQTPIGPQPTLTLEMELYNNVVERGASAGIWPKFLSGLSWGPIQSQLAAGSIDVEVSRSIDLLGYDVVMYGPRPAVGHGYAASISIEVTPLEWLEYRDADGNNPIYDEDTGEQLITPLPRDAG